MISKYLHRSMQQSSSNVPNMVHSHRHEVYRRETAKGMTERRIAEEIEGRDKCVVQIRVRVKFGIAHHHKLIRLDDQQDIHVDPEMIVQLFLTHRDDLHCDIKDTENIIVARRFDQPTRDRQPAGRCVAHDRSVVICTEGVDKCQCDQLNNKQFHPTITTLDGHLSFISLKLLIVGIVWSWEQIKKVDNQTNHINKSVDEHGIKKRIDDVSCQPRPNTVATWMDRNFGQRMIVWRMSDEHVQRNDEQPKHLSFFCCSSIGRERDRWISFDCPPSGSVLIVKVTARRDIIWCKWSICRKGSRKADIARLKPGLH